MMDCRLLAILIFVLCWVNNCLGDSNYKKEDKNAMPYSEEARKFRSGQVHQVWEKANRMKLDALKMTDLYADLRHIDRLMMDHKKAKADGEDEDGMKEANLRDELHATMVKYGLAGRNTKPMRPQGKMTNEKFLKQKKFLEDSKLEKLWNTAVKHGKFTEGEMEDLEVEFMHHKRKVEEYEILKLDTDAIDGLSDNSVEKQLKTQESEEKREKMNDMYEDIMEGYERLHLKTKRGALNGDTVPFTEPRVADLWEEAKTGNFTEKELESIKTELKHFQTKIEKHLFFRDQLKNSAEKVQYHENRDKVPPEHAQKHEHLQSKVQDLAAKVKKLHHDLSSRLGGKNHGEL